MTKMTRRRALSVLAAPAAMAATAPVAKAQAPAPSFTLLLVNDIYKMSDDKGRGGFARANQLLGVELLDSRGHGKGHVGSRIAVGHREHVQRVDELFILPRGVGRGGRPGPALLLQLCGFVGLVLGGAGLAVFHLGLQSG